MGGKSKIDWPSRNGRSYFQGAGHGVTAIRGSRHSRTTAFSIAALLPERSDHGLRITIDHGQQDMHRPAWTPGTTLLLLKGACIEAEAVGEFLPAQSRPLAVRDDPAGRRVVEFPQDRSISHPDCVRSIVMIPSVPVSTADRRRNDALVAFGGRFTRSACA